MGLAHSDLAHPAEEVARPTSAFHPESRTGEGRNPWCGVAAPVDSRWLVGGEGSRSCARGATTIGEPIWGSRKGRGSLDNVLHGDGGRPVTVDGDRPEERRMEAMDESQSCA
jgi:hypothetical protein